MICKALREAGVGVSSIYDRQDGKMSRRLLIGVVLLTVFAVSAFVLRPVGEFGVVDSRIVAAHERAPFDAQGWRTGGVSQRGRMVADLVGPRHFIGMRPDSVIALLGTPDCNQFKAHEPCYRIRLGDSNYELQFPLQSSDPPRVLAVRLNRI